MPILKQGSSGPAVKDLQQKLKKLGFDPKGVDGKFGPGTLVSAASLDPGGSSVAVNVGGLGSNSQFSLTVSGVQDLAGNPIVSTNLRGTIQIDYAMTGTASSWICSGVTNSRPSNSARAWAAFIKEIEARGLAPSCTPAAPRVELTNSTT